jgi:Uma2 family endonuclease
MSTVPERLLSPAEYLGQERHAAFKSEYFQGETFAMAGAGREHNLIVGNLVREVGNRLPDRRCEVYPSDMRVKVTATGLYAYPDVTIVCGRPEFEDHQTDSLLNPMVLFEQLDQTFAVVSLAIQLPMSEVYRQITWVEERGTARPRV